MSAAHWQSGLISFLVVLSLVPLVRILSAYFRLYDLPGPLKIHTQPVPRLGGVAIVLAAAAAMAAARLPIARSGWLLLLAAALVWISGLIDDVRGLHPAIRLSAQIIAAFLLVPAGWTIPLSGNAAVDAAATACILCYSSMRSTFSTVQTGLQQALPQSSRLGISLGRVWW
jgi:UDP-GlcNAc:undecaprenyl-phosphate GlcNAc-1-phosphate transferase